jgi:hypothetical protein
MVTDLAPLAGAETPIENTSAVKPVLDALQYETPTVTTAVEQASLDDLLGPQGRRESTERVVLYCQRPITAATAPMRVFAGDLDTAVYTFWLTNAFVEPLATVTLTSFETPFHYAPPARTFLECARRYITREDPELRETRAYRTFVELADWLEMSQEETARVLGMGRTTPLAWRRAGHEPQPARARRLYQTHALVSTLVRRLGRDEMRRWLAAGQPSSSPLALIAQGDVTGADDLADKLIFGTAPSRERLGAWVEEPADTEPSAAEPKQGPPRRVRRRPPRRRTP